MSFNFFGIHPNNALFEMYDSLCGFFTKDLHGKYTYINHYISEYAGLSNPSELIGKTDFDTPWSEQANSLQNNDRFVMAIRRGRRFYEGAKNHQGKYKIHISHKRPEYRDNTIIGIYGMWIEAPISSLSNLIPLSEKTNFVDIKLHRKLEVNGRQRKTLYWLLNGYSAKDIAVLINMSRRTVEHHIESIKETNHYSSVKHILLNVRVI